MKRLTLSLLLCLMATAAMAEETEQQRIDRMARHLALKFCTVTIDVIGPQGYVHMSLTHIPCAENARRRLLEGYEAVTAKTAPTS